jgi:DNA helicase-2/ATP-dependent DNA helicase PcrA
MNPPSRFLDDIPRELLDIEDEPSRAVAGGSDWGAGNWNRSFGSGERAMGKQESGSDSLHHNLGSLAARSGDVEFREVEVVPDESSGVVLGMKVRHAKFGVGTIRRVEGSGDDQKVIVWFSSVGPKKLLVRFAGLERVF